MLRECPFVWFGIYTFTICYRQTLSLNTVTRKSFSCFHYKSNNQGGNKLVRSNYKFNKRQKELARKKKKEEKRQRKLDKATNMPEEKSDNPPNVKAH